MSSRVLIAGCGYVGSQLGLELTALGHQVWGLRRSVDGLPPPIAGFPGDLLIPSSLSNLPQKLDVVVYAAAPLAADDASYQATYATGVRNLLAALVEQRQHPRRLLFSSSTGVYGQSDGQWVDETSVVEPARTSGQCVLEGEAIVRAAPFPSTIVRFSGIYGPDRVRMIEQVRDGQALLRPGLPSWTNRIHRDDCAGVLTYLTLLAEPGPLYVASDSEPIPYNEMLRWLAKQLAVALPAPDDRASSGTRTHGQNKRCRNARLLASGYRLRYPTFREGYSALLKQTAS